jgi:hypothetical protein
VRVSIGLLSDVDIGHGCTPICTHLSP